ncbi:MAG: family 43 glycosylhydrolase [Prevotellaceae bacterium]|nr:family 43 glycosylhydrolase [Prevotellaceae bacterium]
MKKLLFLICLSLSLQLGAQVYPRVIIRGDYPDPSIMRDGEDFYMTHSPFYYAPGFLIWHSTDLVNWEPICRVLPEYKGSAMAPDLLKHNGKYYIYYPAAGTNWVICADDIRGPWSKPVDLHVRGIDPGHIVDEQGQRWLYTDEGKVIRLTDDGLHTVGEQKKVYDGWVYPKKWNTECMCLESPKLTYHDGYYYMTSAEGGTAGPATSHMAVVARSRSVLGPWENSPYNPVVHTYSEADNWWSKGHGTIIDDKDGNWWIVYHAYAKGYHTLGRQTLIEPIEWTSDGWYKLKSGDKDAVKLAATAVSGLDECHYTLVRRADKSSKTGFISPLPLGDRWTFWKEYAPEALGVRDGQSLSVKAKGSSPADGRWLLMPTEDKSYDASVRVATGGGNMVGLLLYYNEKAFAGVVSDGKTFTVYKDANHKAVKSNRFGHEFSLRLKNRGNSVALEAGDGRGDWETLAERIDVSQMNHNNYFGFFSLRIGLLSAGRGKAVFSDFQYRNAVPCEKDMAAYLMVFHQDEDHSLHFAVSRDGYSFTELNGGKPVFAGDTIAGQHGIRDPHIFRGPDGAFYMSMTDLHVFAKRDGFRTTEWERDGKEYGWGNNRALVLMKSWDLVNWNRTNMRFDTLSAGLADIGCVWAPEVVYDERVGKLMIYFTMRFKNEANKLYYVYVNDDFNKIESAPQILFEYPAPEISAIDGDITRIGDKYHLFYVAHDGAPGIKHAVSDRANGDFVYEPRWYDFEPNACEAPNVWKRIGEDKWVLMYDVYSIHPHNFAFAETSDFVHFTNLGRFNEGISADIPPVMKTTNFASPKHGAVIQITKEEADRIEAFWK